MTPSDIRRLERSWRVFVPLIAVLVVALALLSARSLWRNTSRPPPFVFSADVYYPLETACPGQTLRWHNEFTVTRGKYNTIRTAKVIYDVQRATIVEPDHQLDYEVWTESEWNRPQTGVGTFPLPATLPPGQYEVRVGAAASGTEDTGYRVPFVIPLTCTGGSS